MRLTLSILIILLFLSCKKEKDDTPRIRYTGYSVSVEGSSIDIKIDSVSTVEELVPRLRIDNKRYFTGKGYWIGYNDLMFSIAVHENNAIKPLLTFIDTTKSHDAKIAACYTLHLIGINCTEIGRIIEDFKNPNARRALLELLRKDELQLIVMELLIRDAWQSDVPTIFQILQSSKGDCWPIVSGLVRYDLPDCPINQDLSDDMKNLYIEIPPFEQPNAGLNSPIFKKIYAPILKKFREEYPTQVFIEDTLMDYNYYWPLLSATGEPITTIGLDGLLISTFNKRDYCRIKNNFQYYIENNQIHLCSSKTSKLRWLDWWKNRSQSYKDSLLISKKKTFDPDKSDESEIRLIQILKPFDIPQVGPNDLKKKK